MEKIQTINKDRKEKTNEELMVLETILNQNMFVDANNLDRTELEVVKRMVEERKISETYGLTRDEVTYYDIYTSKICRELNLLYMLEQLNLSEQDTTLLKEMQKEREDKMELFNDMMGL